MKSICIITGASSGLGARFYMEIQKTAPGIDEIWLIARREERLREIVKMYGRIKTVPIILDLSLEESYRELEMRLDAEQDAQISYLINNAGFGKLGKVADMYRSQQTGMIDVNCKALTALCTMCMPYMDYFGKIINVCSIAAFAPNPGLAVYSATKSFVYSYSQSLGHELKNTGITVTAVCPGPMKTEFLDKADITGKSPAFEALPMCDVEKVARGALKAAEKGRKVYTNRIIYKAYRVLSKLLPYRFIMHFSEV